MKNFEQYLRPIFDNMFEGIQILDHDCTYLYLNSTAAAHGRRSREELIGRRMVDAFPGIDQTEMFGLIQRCMVERTPQHVTNEFSYPDGSRSWFNLRMDPVPMGVLVLSIDITSEKVIEEQLREAQKMEAIGRLAGGVAHDFNNLLTVMAGYSDLILRAMSEGDRHREELQEIHDASLRASDLTRQLLAFSRKQRLQSEVLELNDVVERMDRLLRRLIGADIDLVTKLRSDVGLVIGDSGQLGQIIMNLAVNARDAMPDGGKLTIETANVELDQAYADTHVDATPGPHVMLAVSDTGTGMDDDTRARIFEPFFTTKEQGRGTGLGLATVYGIVRQSGGNIWVYSEPGRGTTFKVYLPAVADTEPTARPAPPRQATASAGDETVLIVEDDAAVRGFVRTVLESAGYSVLDTGDPVEAIELARQDDGPIHLLLTDVVLPGINGREVARQIEAARPDLRTVYMSGYTDDAIIHRGDLDHGTAFVDKPITAAALLATVRSTLDGVVR